jgi:hypothetical protein
MRKKMRSSLEIPTTEEIADIKVSDQTIDDNGVHVLISKNQLDRYTNPKFDIDSEIKNLSDSLFKLDDESKKILGIIAKHGPLNETNIAERPYNKSHFITRDVVRYRLGSHPKHQNKSNLIDTGYLIRKKGKRIGNTNKHETIYYLTFKGFLASLSKTTFDKNYLIKSAKDLVSYWVKNKYIPKFTMLLIKYNLALFLLDNKFTAVDLTQLENIEDKLQNLNENSPLVDGAYKCQIKDEKLNELLLETRVWFHVYSQVLSKAMAKFSGKDALIVDKSLDDDIHLMNDKNKKFFYINKFLPYFIRFWYRNLSRLQFEDLQKFVPGNIPEDEPQDLEGIDIDVHAVNVIARKILKKYRLPINFPINDPPVFFGI